MSIIDDELGADELLGCGLCVQFRWQRRWREYGGRGARGRRAEMRAGEGPRAMGYGAAEPTWMGTAIEAGNM